MDSIGSKLASKVEVNLEAKSGESRHDHGCEWDGFTEPGISLEVVSQSTIHETPRALCIPDEQRDEDV